MNANGRVVTSLAMVLIFTAFVLWAFTFRREAALMPLLCRWPGHIQPGTVSDELVTFLDLSATAVDLGGVKVPEASSS